MAESAIATVYIALYPEKFKLFQVSYKYPPVKLSIGSIPIQKGIGFFAKLGHKPQKELTNGSIPIQKGIGFFAKLGHKPQQPTKD